MSIPVVGSDDDNHTKSPQQFLICGDEEAFFGWLSIDCVSNFAGEGKVFFVDVCWSLELGSVQQTTLKGAAEFAKEAERDALFVKAEPIALTQCIGGGFRSGDARNRSAG